MIASEGFPGMPNMHEHTEGADFKNELAIL